MMSLFSLLVAISSLGWQAPAQTPAATAASPAPAVPRDPRFDRMTPEGTLRVFTLGVSLGNEDLLKATMLPVETEDMQLLLAKPPADAPAPKVMKQMIGDQPVRSLPLGEVFKLPRGRDWTITDKDVNDSQLVLVLGDSPLPTRMYKSKSGLWWVDANPVIAGRKAAAKKKAEIDAAKSAPETPAAVPDI